MNRYHHNQHEGDAEGEMFEIDVLQNPQHPHQQHPSTYSQPTAQSQAYGGGYRGMPPTRPPRPAYLALDEQPYSGHSHQSTHSGYSNYSGYSQWGSSDPTLAGVQTPGDSRSATPTPMSGHQTPMPHAAVSPFGSPFDSRPSSMVQSNLSLAHLLPGDRTIPVKEGADRYSIDRLADRDDIDIWKGWKRGLYYLVPFLTLLNTLLYFAYLALRIACLIWAQQAQGQAYPQAWIFVGIEIAVAIPSMAHNIWTMMAIKKRNRPQLRLRGDEVPTVDVFVTCCGEDDDLVMDTVRAALEQDYPRDRFRVIILDDGKSAGLEAMANQCAMTYSNLLYWAREKIPGKPHHFKAGNLNYGLDQVHYLPGGAGQFMAALDADMIPEPMWLRAVLPHLLIDPKMALACPPQLFYNTPPSDPLAQSLDFFVHVIEPIKDAMGVAWCTGSGYVVRREALDEIGNFPLGSLAEDVATSTLMLGKGWRTAYVHEPLQFGTVPEDYGSHLKQRTRWAIGTVDTSFKLNFCLWGEKVRQMTFSQRFSGFLYAALSVYTILLTISMFAIPIILVMEKPLVAYANDEQLRWLIRACFATTIANRVNEFVLSRPAGYHTTQRGSRYQLWMSPYIALCIIRSFILPTWLGGQTQAFKPTGSLASALNERDPALKKNMLRRLWAILINYMALFHFAFVYLTLVAVVLTSYRCFYIDTSTKDLLVCLLTHAFWPPLTFIFICSSLWTPVAYAIDPPQMPEREDLLIRDPKTKVAHPTEKSKKIAFGGQAAWFELEYTLTTAYTCLVFVATFFF